MQEHIHEDPINTDRILSLIDILMSCTGCEVFEALRTAPTDNLIHMNNMIISIVSNRSN